MKPIKESVLFKTSSASDVQSSGGKLTIAGLRSISKKNVESIKQIKYRTEVVQVYTLVGSSYTPAAGTKYSIEVYDPNRRESGYQESAKIYSYVTPSVITIIGATAADQREYIHGQLVSQVNNATRINRATAASLGSGNGFTITDNGGYYPVRSQSMTNVLGANLVDVRTNPDGSGFTSADVTLTTAAVASFGVGAKLLQEAPVMDNMFGNLISGVLEAPPLTIDGTTAVSGQNYDGFEILSLSKVETPTITGHYTYIDRTSLIYVDNGTGSSTTNLAGFIAFERELLREAYQTYSLDAAVQVDFFDNQFIFQGAAGAVPTTTGANKMISGAQWTYTQIGTQTLTTPTPGATGLILDQDLTDTEGAEYTPSLLTICPKQAVVGQTAFSVSGRIVAADWTDAAWLIGVRRKAAHAADFNDYTDLAAVGTLAANGDLITTQGILNNAATVSTSTGIIPTDAASVSVYLSVSITGVVTIKVNGTAYPVYSAGTTPLVLDSGDIFIPFFRYVNVSTGDPDLVISRIAFVSDDTIIS